MNSLNLYREEILDHWRYPQNFGRLTKPDSYSRQTNPFCGDEIEIWIKLGPFSTKTKTSRRCPRNPPRACPQCLRKIKKISFEGKGCAISLASASILTEYTLGKSKDKLTKFSEKDMLSLLGIEVSETRKKCALLVLVALKDCLANY